MADLLRRWLNDEVRMSFPVSNFEAEFASGHAFAELLHRVKLCPDYAQYSNKAGPDAQINNYTRLQPLLAGMGVVLDPKIVSHLMSEHRGTAQRILYSIKVYVDELAKEAGHAGRRKKGDAGAATGGGGATRPGADSAALTLPASQKQRPYDETVRNIFDRNVRLVATNPNRLMEALATHKYVQDMEDQARRVGVLSQSRSAFRVVSLVSRRRGGSFHTRKKTKTAGEGGRAAGAAACRRGGRAQRAAAGSPPLLLGQAGAAAAGGDVSGGPAHGGPNAVAGHGAAGAEG